MTLMIHMCDQENALLVVEMNEGFPANFARRKKFDSEKKVVLLWKKLWMLDASRKFSSVVD